jgi:hypothetical protein
MSTAELGVMVIFGEQPVISIPILQASAAKYISVI